MAKAKYMVISLGHWRTKLETDFAYALRTAREFAQEENLPVTILIHNKLRATVQPTGDFEDAK